MKADVSLSSLHYHGLCKAIEKDGVVCFKKKYCKGYCFTHYDRIRRFGSINLPVRKSKRCQFITCNEAYYSSNYCKNHYSQLVRRNTKKKCNVEECINHAVGKYCAKHRTRLSRYGSLAGSGKKKGGTFKPGNTYIKQKEYKICLAQGCCRDSNSYKITKGLCPKHYSRWLKTGIYEDSFLPSGKESLEASTEPA